MHHRYNPDSYPASSYDDDFCLKPPFLLWLAVLYLSRGTVLPILVGFGHFAGVNVDAMTLMRGLWRADELLPALLALPVIYALCRRVPAASRPVRWIWSHGRTLLALSAGADIVLAVVSLMSLADLEQAPATVCACVADAYFLVYFLAARRIRDTFSDFPAPYVLRRR